MMSFDDMVRQYIMVVALLILILVTYAVDSNTIDIGNDKAQTFGDSKSRTLLKQMFTSQVTQASLDPLDKNRIYGTYFVERQGNLTENFGQNRIISKRDISSFYPYPSPSLVQSMTPSPELQQWITNEHNRLRRLVPATNMQILQWDASLAYTAQNYANQCNFDHSSGRGSVGENIYAAAFADLTGAIKMWYDEVAIPECGCTNLFTHCCGHYTQLAWAETNRVGCGFSQCASVAYAPGQLFVLICHYSPAGNIVRYDGNNLVSIPGFRYQSAAAGPCSECYSGSQCTEGLCSSK